MARPQKIGLEYFPQDTDIHTDRKIRRLLNEFGATGYLIYDYIKTLCYKENGYYAKYDKDFCFDVADVLKSGITENLVREVLKGCFRMSLFDKKVFDAFLIITSSGIQKRFVKAKKGGVIDSKHIVIDEETPISEDKTPTKRGLSTQSKVNKSKTKESKDDAPAIHYTEEQILSFEKFQLWIADNAPRVGQLSQPFTIQEFLKIKVMGEKFICALLKDMDNYKPLLSNYVSAYKTFTKWAKRELK